jgi:pimeloyl-ACP methyl ester carboxylesterase
MSANPRVDSHHESAGQIATAFYFGSSEKNLFGWLHRSRSESAADVGLVICQPFGYEAMCSHRSVRTFAEAAATLGIPALRFDYLGTGDSAEIEPEADQLEVWSGNVAAAVAELRRRTGVSRVLLLGIRLGGLLATLAASRCEGVQGLILISPVVSGRRYLRDLRTTRLAASLGSNRGGLSDVGPADEKKTLPAGSVEVSGFSLSAATLAALARVDLMQMQALPVSEMLVIDGTSMPVTAQWSKLFSDRGERVEYVALPGLIEMIMTDPQFAVTSQPMVATIGKWLRQRLNRPAVAVADSDQTGSSKLSPPSVMLTLPDSSRSQLDLLTERPMLFGADGALFGIVTAPRQGELRRRAVILLNAGADHHVGVSRMNVSLARRWARQGYFVLRMDLGGIGDSNTRPGDADDDVFPDAALDDVRAGIQVLVSNYGIRDIALAGLCSGAYHSLRAAAAGLPLSRVLLVNPQNYFWKKGMTVKNLQLAEVVRNPQIYRRKMFSRAAWKKLLSGRVNVWRIVKIYLHRPVLTLKSEFRNLTRRLRIRLADDLGWELEEIVARGVQIIFVFARDEPGIELLQIEGGSSVGRLAPKCRVRILEDGDHIFSQSGPRAVLESILSEELFSRTEVAAEMHAEADPKESTV